MVVKGSYFMKLMLSRGYSFTEALGALKALNCKTKNCVTDYRTIVCKITAVASLIMLRKVWCGS